MIIIQMNNNCTIATRKLDSYVTWITKISYLCVYSYMVTFKREFLNK